MLKIINSILLKIDNTEKSAYISMILKPINVLLGLIYTPLLLMYLGDIYYGLWVTILSVISWINYFDVGIGNGLRNVLSDLLIDNENEYDINRVVSTAYILLTLIACLIMFVLIVLTFFVNWNVVFSTSIDMRLPLFISFVFICINFVLALSNSILYAMQKAELVSLRNIYVQIINIIGIILLNQFTNSNLVYVSILFGLSTMFVYIYNSIKIWRINNQFIPKRNSYDKKWLQPVCNIGIKFFIIQLMGLAMFTVDNVIITHFFGAQEVTPFSIVDKMFNTVYSVWAAFLVPYWSGTTAAFSKKDYCWIKKSLSKIIKFFILFVIGFVLLALLFNPIAKIWLHKTLDYQVGIVPIMCIFYILYSILAIECQFINGTGKINVQLIAYIILGAANIPLSIALGVHFNLGALGVRLATTILVLIMIIILGFNLKIIMKNMEKN